MVAASEIAIFLLSTALIAKDPNAKDGGALGRWSWNYDFYTNRTLATVDTWGRHFPQLFFVWGDGDAEREFFGRRGAACARETVRETARRGGGGGAEWDVARCDGATVSVLFATACSAAYYGAHGPCCRAEAAMRFALAGGVREATRWFAFLDDDVYVRARPTLAMLGRFDASAPLMLGGPALKSGTIRGYNDGVRRAGGERALDPPSLNTRRFSRRRARQHTVKHLRGQNCHIECVHGFPWAMTSFTTMAALWPLGASLRAGALEAFCSKSGLTHDGGVGGFLAWEHAIPFVPLDRSGAIVKLSGKMLGAQENGRPPEVLCNAPLVHGLGREYNPREMRELLDGCPGGADEGLTPLVDDAPAARAPPAPAPNRTKRARGPGKAAAAAAGVCIGSPLKLEGWSMLNWTSRAAPGDLHAGVYGAKDCGPHVLPPGVRLHADKHRCLCESDGQPTLDGHCTKPRPKTWMGEPQWCHR